MTEIKTVAELDALPEGARVIDKDEWTWVKQPSGNWYAIEENAGSSSMRIIDLWSPIVLAESPDLHMTKCVHDACTTTTPLPPGSSWACSSHNITLGASR